MNRVILAFICLFLLGRAGVAQTIDPGYSIARWKGFRDAAITHTFDDNTSNQLPVAMPLYDQYDFKVTFFTVTSWGPNWSELAAASANGHEVASHTVTHPYLNTLDAGQQQDELANSHEAIETHIPDVSAQTLAYPYCVRGIDSLTSRYYIAARGCSGNIEPGTPADMLNISSNVVGPEGSIKTAADMIARSKDAAESRGWLVLLMHGVDNDGGWSPVSSSALKVYLQWLNASRATYWVDTFGSVVRYIRERDDASVIQTSESEGAITVRVTDTLDDDVYDVPISIRRQLPDGWASASAAQNGEPVESKIEEVESIHYVQFDAVPDRGDVVLTKQTTTGTESDAPEAPEQGSLLKPYPNPATSSTTFQCRLTRSGRVKVSIFDLLGRRLETLTDGTRNSGQFDLTWNASTYSPGAYFYRMETDTDTDTGLILLSR